MHRHSNPAWGLGCSGAGQSSSHGTPSQNTPVWLHRALGQTDTWLHLPEGCLLILTVPIQLESRITSPPAPDSFMSRFLEALSRQSAYASSGTGLGLLGISAHPSFLSEQFCKLKPLPQVSKGRYLALKQPEERKK